MGTERPQARIARRILRVNGNAVGKTVFYREKILQIVKIFFEKVLTGNKGYAIIGSSKTF